MNNSKQFLSLARTVCRQNAKASTTAVTNTAKIQRIKKLQEQLQLAQNDPVHLKGGFRDVILYRTSVAMVLFCVGYSLEAFYRIATK